VTSATCGHENRATAKFCEECGAPVAHEDDAQRGCYAALHLRDEIARYATEVKREPGVDFSTRIGHTFGDVVVERIAKLLPESPR
jgi:class 3 adenylate cyclase